MRPGRIDPDRPLGVFQVDDFDIEQVVGPIGIPLPIV
jgi:hypothetical protein